MDADICIVHICSWRGAQKFSVFLCQNLNYVSESRKNLWAPRARIIHDNNNAALWQFINEISPISVYPRRNLSGLPDSLIALHRSQLNF